jgi:SAM-dependent methyltransferase
VADTAREDLEQVRSYYRTILPFYELETLARKDLAFWRRIVRRERSRAVLEIGAGFGRVTAALAPLAAVAGLDVSLDLLAGARRRLPAAGRRLVAGDARRLPFPAAFDLVVAPGDPFSHLLAASERRRALAEVARVLLPGGRFVLDALRRTSPEPWRRVRRTRLPAGGSLLVDETWRPAGERDLWKATFRYRLRDARAERAAEASFLARSWNDATLAAEFAAAGLEIESRAGGFAGEPADASSRRLVVVARKAAAGERAPAKTTTARASGAAASRRPRASARAGRSRGARRGGTGRASRGY